MKLLLSSLVLASSLFSISALDISKKYDEAIKGFGSSITVAKMILVNARGQKSIRDLEMKTLEQDEADKTLSTFLGPADIKGTKTLTHGHIGKSDDQWLYLPALKRVKRIASRNKSGSFMGSEFSFEDIGNQNYKKFTYSENAEEINLDDKTYYKSIRYPKDKYSGYTKQVTYIEKNTFLLHKVEYYDRKKELLKTAIFKDYKKLQGIWRVGQIEMSNHQNDKSTTIVWSDDKVKAGLSKKEFTKRMLKR